MSASSSAKASLRNLSYLRQVVLGQGCLASTPAPIACGGNVVPMAPAAIDDPRPCHIDPSSSNEVLSQT